MASESSARVRRFVDMWALPGVHPTNIELLQQLKTADTQHFTKSMDVVGTVSEQDQDSGKWEKTHMIGIRTDVWRLDEAELANSLRILKEKRQAELKQRIKHSGRLDAKQSAMLDEHLEQDLIMQMQTGDLERRRLVLKMFKTTTSRVRWSGTIEEVTTTEIHNSIGSKRDLLTMATMLPRNEYLTYVQENHRTFRWPSIFTFCFYDDQQMWHISLKQRWFSLGVDFDVEVGGQRIGKLDGKLIAFGADSFVNLHGHPLVGNKRFVNLLTLFASSVGFHRAMRRSLKRRVKAARAGASYRHIIEDEELRLRHNGRAAA